MEIRSIKWIALLLVARDGSGGAEMVMMDGDETWDRRPEGRCGHGLLVGGGGCAQCAEAATKRDLMATAGLVGAGALDGAPRRARTKNPNWLMNQIQIQIWS